LTREDHAGDNVQGVGQEMAEGILNFRNALVGGFLLAALLLGYLVFSFGGIPATLPTVLVRWLHVVFGAIWVGLIWYFNVASANAPETPDGARATLGATLAPALGRVLMVSSTMSVLFGLVLATMNGYVDKMLSLDVTEGFVNSSMVEIGVGAWIGIVMLINVHAAIWPSLRRAYNVGGRFKTLSPERRVAAARRALFYSRVNLMLSIPLLLAMVGFAHLDL
jgi:uncharacterized membrane protein